MKQLRKTFLLEIEGVHDIFTPHEQLINWVDYHLSLIKKEHGLEIRTVKVLRK